MFKPPKNKLVPPEKWATLPKGQWVLMRLKGDPGLYYFQIEDNRLAALPVPVVTLLFPESEGCTLIIRKQIARISLALSPTELRAIVASLG